VEMPQPGGGEQKHPSKSFKAVRDMLIESEHQTRRIPKLFRDDRLRAADDGH
jgi:hypothetical protein